MAVLEIGLGLLCAAAGGGVGWQARKRFESKSRANEQATKKAAGREKSARRIAGGQKAAATRKAKAEQKAEQAQAAQIDQAFPGGRTVDESLYGRAGNGALHGGE